MFCLLTSFDQPRRGWLGWLGWLKVIAVHASHVQGIAANVDFTYRVFFVVDKVIGFATLM